MTIALLVISTQMHKALDLPTNSQKNLITDWQKLPILSISKKSSDCSYYGLQDLISKTFPGTEAGCNCKGIWSKKVKPERQNKINLGSCNANETKADCIDYRGSPSVPLKNLGGYYLCANKGGSNFIEAVRVDANGNCPKGYQACNPKASFENRLCATDLTKCPVNSIQFTTNVNDLTDPEYETVQINNGFWLKYSKT